MLFKEFSDMLLMAIFVEVTDNECIIARHLREFAIVVYVSNMAEPK